MEPSRNPFVDEMLSIVREFVRLHDEGFTPRDADGDKHVDTDALIENARDAIEHRTKSTP